MTENKNDIPKEIFVNIAEFLTGDYWPNTQSEPFEESEKYIHEDEVKKIIQISIRCHDANTKSDEKIIDEVLDNFKVDFNLETIVALREQIKELEKKAQCWDKLKEYIESYESDDYEDDELYKGYDLAFKNVQKEIKHIEQEVEADE